MCVCGDVVVTDNGNGANPPATYRWRKRPHRSVPVVRVLSFLQETQRCGRKTS